MRTFESGRTGAVIIIDQIDAGGAVGALSATVVDVDFTVAADPAVETAARVVARSVAAVDSVPARILLALVHI